MKIITLAVIKGGTGKTTTAAALSQAAVKDGKRVLAIDLDPQANMTYSLGANQNRAGSFELITGTSAENAIQGTAQGIDVISASPNLATLKTSTASAKRLRTALEPIKKNYDFIIIDTPPTMGELTFNALQASTDLVIPLEADINSLQGLYQITDIAQQMKRSNPNLNIKGFVLTRFDSRPKINRYLRDTISAKGKEAGAPFLMAIRAGVAIREAQAMQENIFDYAPNSKPAVDYKALYEIVKE